MIILSDNDDLPLLLERARHEAAIFRAVLEGAQYRDIPGLLGLDVENARKVGEAVAARTKKLIDNQKDS